MATPRTKKGSYNAGRLFQAIGRIGYHPVSAILDIVDNSVSARATKIWIKFHHLREEKEGRGRRRPVIDKISIIDNGKGMDEKALENALTLGSSESYYTAGTLSKFGMGLKSAASSLGKRLEIVSRAKGNSTIEKVVLDQDLLIERGDYSYVCPDPLAEEIELLNDHCGDGSGTIVTISETHKESLPGPAEIVDRLKREAGIVYYYYLSSPPPEGFETLRLVVEEDEILPVDPLFQAEIGQVGDKDLNEADWDGLEPAWITRSRDIPVDLEGSVYAKVAISQLPHPPSVGQSGKMTPKHCRDRYLISAGNYGFYIYRNYRLISWAERFGNLVPQDQDLYSFRARLLIENSADDILNLDVAKSRIHLSQIASDHLKPEILEAVKKSKKAWNAAKRNLDRKIGRGPHEEANEELDRIGDLEIKDDQLEEKLGSEQEKRNLRGRRERAVSTARATEEESERLRERGERVQLVPMLDNNQLWERAHDPKKGLIVRINEGHRFMREFLLGEEDNRALLIVLDYIFYAIARGEWSLVYKSEHHDELVERIMAEFRERVGEELSDIVRRTRPGLVGRR